jgi:hypothetical protein
MSTLNRDFTIFRQLPIELRLEIWKMAIAEPRTIRIKTISVDIQGTLSHQTVAFRAATPALLHTNQESREEAPKVYTLAFENNLISPVYFDFKRDILAFPNLFCPEIFIKKCSRGWPKLDSNSEYLKVQHLALITYWVPTEGIFFKVQKEKAMFYFPCLETFSCMSRILSLSQSQKVALETEFNDIWTPLLKSLRATARASEERNFVWKEAEGIDDMGRWLGE